MEKIVKVNILLIFIISLWIGANFNTIPIPAGGEYLYLILANNLPNYTINGIPTTIGLPIIPFLIALSKSIFFISDITAFKFISVLSTILSACVLFLIAYHYSNNNIISITSITLFLSNTMILYFSVNFFREPIFIFLVLLWFYLLITKKYITSALVCSIAILTKEQGIFLISIGLAIIYMNERSLRKITTYAAASLILPSIWIFKNFYVLTTYYSMPLDFALQNPSILYITGIVHGTEAGLNGFNPQPLRLSWWVAYHLVPLIFIIALYGLWNNIKKYKECVVFTMLFGLFHITIPGNAETIRFMTPVIPFFAIFASIGLSKILSTHKYNTDKYNPVVFIIILLTIFGVQFYYGIEKVNSDALNRVDAQNLYYWVSMNIPKNSTIIEDAYPPFSSFPIIYKGFQTMPNVLQHDNYEKYYLSQVYTHHPDTPAYLITAWNYNTSTFRDYIVIKDFYTSYMREPIFILRKRGD